MESRLKRRRNLLRPFSASSETLSLLPGQNLTLPTSPRGQELQQHFTSFSFDSPTSPEMKRGSPTSSLERAQTRKRSLFKTKSMCHLEEEAPLQLLPPAAAKVGAPLPCGRSTSTGQTRLLRRALSKCNLYETPPASPPARGDRCRQLIRQSRHSRSLSPLPVLAKPPLPSGLGRARESQQHAKSGSLVETTPGTVRKVGVAMLTSGGGSDDWGGKVTK